MFDIKFDLRRKARIVAGGNRTDPHGESCYSGVVPMDAVRLALFLLVSNSMKACAPDSGNAFLHEKTHENYYIISGPEFEELEARIILMINLGMD